MKIITVASLKGGVGKTTAAVFLSQSLVKAGRHVLAVDCDANNNMSDYFLRDLDPEEIDRKNVFHVLTRRLDAADAVYRSSSGVDVIPGTPSLNRLSAETAGNPGPLLAFGTRLRKTAYDFVIIDTPPYAGPELRAALYAADLVISPVAPVRWVFQGAALLDEEIALAREAAGRAPALVFLPSTAGRSQGEVEKLKLLMSEYSVLQTIVHRSGALRSCAEKGRPLKEDTQPYLEFKALAQEVSQWLNQPKKKPANG